MINNAKLKTAVALGLMGLLSRADNPLQEAKEHILNPMSEEDKYRAQGLKPFEFFSGTDFVTVWAINQKNAIRKFKKYEIHTK